MIITVVAVLMVQTPIDDVADVVAMWYCLMSTALTMNMTLTIKGMVTVGRVLAVYLQNMLVHMVAMHMVQMSVMQIVNVVAMFDGSVSTACAVYVVVIGMNVTAHNASLKMIKQFVSLANHYTPFLSQSKVNFKISHCFYYIFLCYNIIKTPKHSVNFGVRLGLWFWLGA